MRTNRHALVPRARTFLSANKFNHIKYTRISICFYLGASSAFEISIPFIRFIFQRPVFSVAVANVCVCVCERCALVPDKINGFLSKIDGCVFCSSECAKVLPFAIRVDIGGCCAQLWATDCRNQMVNCTILASANKSFYLCQPMHMAAAACPFVNGSSVSSERTGHRICCRCETIRTCLSSRTLRWMPFYVYAMHKIFLKYS